MTPTDSINIERELSGIINRVNRVINKPPVSSNVENRQKTQRTEAKTPNRENFVCPYGSTLSFSEACLEENKTKPGPIDFSLKTPSTHDNQPPNLNLRVPLAESKNQNGRSVDQSYERLSAQMSFQEPIAPQHSREVLELSQSKNVLSSRHSIDTGKVSTSVHQSMRTDERPSKVTPLAVATSLQAITDVSVKANSREQNTHVQSSQSRKTERPPQSRDSSSLSILSSHVDRFSSRATPLTFVEERLDPALQEMKLEELCTRLKFISKKEFMSLQAPLRLLNEAIISNVDAKEMVRSLSIEAKSGLDRLESAFHKAELIHYQVSAENSALDMITQATLSTIKSCARDLLLTLRAYSGMSDSSASLRSATKELRATSPITRGDQGRYCQTPEPDDYFENQSLRLAMKKETKPQNDRMSSFKKFNFTEFDEEPANQDLRFKRMDEQVFGFNIQSLAQCDKKIFVGFEDGAITEVRMDTTKGLSLVKCYRFKSEPVTDMLVVDCGDAIGSQHLLAACGLNSPTIVVMNTHSGKQLFELSGHNQFVTKMVKITEAFVASCSFDRYLKVWDIRTGSCCYSQAIHDSPLISCTYSPTAALIASGDLSGNIVLSSISFYQGGTFKSCETYLKFSGCGPILEICFDVHNKLISFEGSTLRMYDCRGTVFREVKNPFFISSVSFMDPQTLLIVDTAGTPHIVDYEKALNDSSLPRPPASDQLSEAELASLMISQRVTGSLPRGQLLRLPGGGRQVYSALGKRLQVHSLINN